MNIRLLRADEIECRLATVKKTDYGVGCSVLLYKDARCDMNILDEVFGPLGWERSHQQINNSLFCTISVYDEEHQRWIHKQDVGTESYTEKEKGQASDSFKRACFNLGIGRELYTAPFIWINLNEKEVTSLGNDRYTSYTKFEVSEIGYEGRKINKLVIKDDKGNVRYTLNAPNEPVKKAAATPKEEQGQEQTAAENTPQGTEEPTQQPKHLQKGKRLTDKQVNQLFAIAKEKGYKEEQVRKGVCVRYKVDDLHDLTKKQYDEVCSGYEKAPVAAK